MQEFKLLLISVTVPIVLAYLNPLIEINGKIISSLRSPVFPFQRPGIFKKTVPKLSSNHWKNTQHSICVSAFG